ncbi:hypothetical protein [Cupriavidus pauculus]|uniref:hypothetical protein n=1 Tax=Cupriavidus pauculus TaxID=82633 RepID=UPI000A5C57EE|nr:hypothetical protein [Cupriavidus pauculus]MBY4729476.1 hypothetical protein [Cupriavidus pauculus]
MKRRNILAASIACGALPLAGCSVFRRKPLTQELFADKQYQEEVSSFMMTADRRKLIVLGKRNHYVLDMPRQLETILTSSFRPKVEAGFSDFKATGDNFWPLQLAPAESCSSRGRTSGGRRWIRTHPR